MQLFFKQVAEKNGIDFDWILSQLKEVNIDKKKTDKLFYTADNAKEFTTKFDEYSNAILSKKQLAVAKKYYIDNARTLKKIYKQYGVNGSLIVATIGVESNYGRNLGRYYVLPTLLRHSFEDGRREKFYRKELKNLIVLANKNGWDTLRDLKGSYSGAIGPGQFMPSSAIYYAVDGDTDGISDIIYSVEDVLHSVANYYKKAKWKRNGSVAKPIGVDEMKGLSDKKKKSILAFPLSNGKKRYFETFHNFKVIKRYNNSNYYAMTVFLLAEKIRERIIDK